MSYEVFSVYSLTLEDMNICIIPCNKDPTNIGPPSVQIAVFSAKSDDENNNLVPYCVSVNIVPNNPTFAAWTASLEAVNPFSNRNPVNVRVYSRFRT